MSTILHTEAAEGKEQFVHSWFFSSDYHDDDSHVIIRCLIEKELTEFAIVDVISYSFEESEEKTNVHPDYEITFEELINSDSENSFKFEFTGGSAKLTVLSHSNILEKHDFVFMMLSSLDEYQKYL